LYFSPSAAQWIKTSSIHRSNHTQFP
jgi:hypothetical protein